MGTDRKLVVYKTTDYIEIMKISDIIEKFDNFDNLSKCTHISHMLSGNIIKEKINRSSVNTVKRDNNFFINLN